MARGSVSFVLRARLSTRVPIESPTPAMIVMKPGESPVTMTGSSQPGATSAMISAATVRSRRPRFPPLVFA
jgi:hypothetical protein